MLFSRCSAVAHHISVATGGGFESSSAADLHFGAKIHVGTDYQVREYSLYAKSIKAIANVSFRRSRFAF